METVLILLAIIALCLLSWCMTTQVEKFGSSQPIGGYCDFATDCKGWKGTIGCCKGKCTHLKEDYVGTYWCPDVCKKCLICKPGSC